MSFLARAWQVLKAPVFDLIDYLQAKFPPNRVVVLLTPLVFVPVAGYVTAWVAQHFPGLPTFSTTEIAGFFAAGAVAALVKAYKWLDGWQLHEERENSDNPNF